MKLKYILNKKTVFTISGLLGILYILKKLFTKNDKFEIKEKSDKKYRVYSNSFNELDQNIIIEKIENIQSKINKEKNILLSYSVIYEINELIFLIFENNYKEKYTKNKYILLNYINDPSLYSFYFKKYQLEELEIILERITIVVLKMLKIDREIFDNSFKKAIKNNHNLAYLSSFKIQKFKNNITFINIKDLKLNLKIVVDFINYQLLIFDNFNINLFDSDYKISNQIKIQYIHDLALNKYGFGLNEILKNPNITNKKIYKDLMAKLSTKYDYNKNLLFKN